MRDTRIKMRHVSSKPSTLMLAGGLATAMAGATVASAQLIDRTLIPNPANEGVGKSLTDQVGAGRGDTETVGSSLYIISRDPARSVRRGRQIFQRKFSVFQGFGPRTADGVGGDIAADASLGAGLADSCAACHGRPRGSAGFGGDVVTRPDSRDAPHLFGLGLQEQLADEITREIRFQSLVSRVQCEKLGVTTQAFLRGRKDELPIIGSIDYGRVIHTPVQSTSGEAVRLRFAHSGKCADVDGARKDNGTNIQQWTCNSGGNQRWRLIGRQLVADHTGTDPSTDQAKCMDVSLGDNQGQNSGQNVHLWRCHENFNQQFELVDRGNGQFQVRSVNSGKCLDVKGNSTSSGANIQQFTCKTTNAGNQLVTLEPFASGSECSEDTSQVVGVNPDLRVRPFFAEGGTISMREFIVGAFNAEMGLESPDPDLVASSAGALVKTPAGMVLDGGFDSIEAPPVSSTGEDGDGDGVTNEIPTAIIDHTEFYLLNYFKAGRGKVDSDVLAGEIMVEQFGCTNCHVKDLTIRKDRRVADVETMFASGNPNMPVNPFNRLFATASLRLEEIPHSGTPAQKRSSLQSFIVRNIHTDFKRHDMGLNFAEVNYDSTPASPNLTRFFITEPLWGVGDTAPYGHDGRSGNVDDVILRHNSPGAEGIAITAAQAFANTSEAVRIQIRKYLDSLILFSPDDTSSNLNPANSATANFPQFGHGSINLGALFNDPNEGE